MQLLDIHARALQFLMRRVAIEGTPPFAVIFEMKNRLAEVERISRTLGEPRPPVYELVKSLIGTFEPQAVAAPSLERLRAPSGASPPGILFNAFISYSRADETAVHPLVTALTEQGVSVWVDFDQIKPAESIPGRINQGLRESRYLVACLSTSYINSSYCQAEFEATLNRDLSEKTSRLVVALVNDGTMDKVPLLARARLAVDARTTSGVSLLASFLLDRNLEDWHAR